MNFISSSFWEIEMVFFSLSLIQAVHSGKSCFGKVCVYMIMKGC